MSDTPQIPPGSVADINALCDVLARLKQQAVKLHKETMIEVSAHAQEHVEWGAVARPAKLCTVSASRFSVVRSVPLPAND